MVKWLRVYAVTAEGLGSILGQGTKMPHSMDKKKKERKKEKVIDEAIKFI